MVRGPDGFPGAAPEFTGPPERRVLPQVPGEWEQEPEIAVPPEERQSPYRTPPPRRLPEADPQGGG